jgi:chorismate mutase
MDRIKYFLVSADALPEVFSKVVEAKGYIASGEASSALQAAKMAGISRSAYYKYKDAVFEYGDSSQTVTVNAKLKDNAGVLSAFMNELYKAGANVLSINQSLPVNTVADVSVTFRSEDMICGLDELMDNIKEINGVNSAKIGS